MKPRALINDFAIRCFRDTADHDYIAARACYRAELIQQFHWLSLQAIEKYLKGILLLNRIRAKNVNHDLERALKLTEQLPFPLTLSTSTEKLIEHLDTFGRFRYLESSFFIYGAKLVELDRAVWEIRRFCRSLNYDIEDRNGGRKNMLAAELAAIDASKKRPPHEFKRVHGFLEKVLAKSDHPARTILVWQNAFFTKRARKGVRMKIPFHATNSPLSLHPEILDDVLEFVFLPKDVVRAYREAVSESLR